MLNWRDFCMLLLSLCLALTQNTGSIAAEAFAFRHPGLLHACGDLERMRAAVAAGEDPIHAGFEVFRQHHFSQTDYRMRGPGRRIGRAPSVNNKSFDWDAGAAYQCALMWHLTGEQAYADKAKEILNAWSTSLRRVSGKDAVLMAGLGPFKFVNAAELIRYGDAGWSEAEIEECERMLTQAIYPTIKDFSPFANGNWDAAAIKTMMAIGVFCNDRETFERAIRYYVHGHGNGRITHYVINEAGQVQESGRDMPHTQLGLALLAECSEIAWQQGLDLFSVADHRLLKGFEYTARYALGHDVPFEETVDRTGLYHHTRIASRKRDYLRPVFEHVYNHYVNRAGLEAPYVQRAAEKLRPEGALDANADHPGFGTFLFTRAPRDWQPSAKDSIAPAAPAGMIAHGTSRHVELAWVPSVDAESYTVKRSHSAGGPIEVIAEDVTEPTYIDESIEGGRLYHYTVVAVNSRGESADAYPTSISAGLPAPWKTADVGLHRAATWTEYDGETFTLEGGGHGLGDDSDSFHIAHAPLDADGEFVARHVPQVSSQFSSFGLTMRGNLDANAPSVALVVLSERGDRRRGNGWRMQVRVRTAVDSDTETVADIRLREPQVRYSRLMEPIWLKLRRRGGSYLASYSFDGSRWEEAATVETRLGQTIRAGLVAASGLENVSTTVRFDQVAITGWTAPVASD